MIQQFHFDISAADAGRRLDDFLASRFGGLSRMRIAALLGAGACQVNGRPQHAGFKLAEGDRIALSLAEEAPTAMTPEALPLDILHEDEDLLVVVKPAGQLCHPSKAERTGTLANALAHHLNRERLAAGPLAHGEALDMARPGLVHRLDRATSGLMVIAKNKRAHRILSRHFRERRVEKRYLALVRGRMAEDAGEVSAPIGRDPEARPHWRVMAEGKPARTRFRVRERLPGATFIEMEPITGRTNQLRIHCAHAGHPILGDELYGPSDLSNGEFFLCLHAWRLGFHHPAGGAWRVFEAPPPPPFAARLAALRGSAGRDQIG